MYIAEKTSYFLAHKQAIRLLLRRSFQKLKSFFYNACYRTIVLFVHQNTICFFFSSSSTKFNNITIIRNAFGNDKRCVSVHPDTSFFDSLLFLARAKVIVLDQSHSIISNINLVNKTTCIQCWHSSGWYKKVGFDAKRVTFPKKYEYERISRIHRNIDYFVISDRKLINNYAKAFHIESNHILPLGLARTDMLFALDCSGERMHFEQEHSKAVGKKIFLYAPTFRTAPGGVRFHNYTLDIKKLQEALGDNWIFLLRKHPSIKQSPPQGWIDVSDMPLESCLAISDAMATDYSSILFDYSFFRRPIFLIVSDGEEYQNSQRGLYRLPHELVGDAVCHSTEDLIGKVTSNTTVDHGIWENYMSSCDGHSTYRIVSLINNVYHGEK